MQQNYKEIVSGFDESSRLWVYLADRKLTDREVNLIEAELDYFTKDWTAHGKDLKAVGKIVLDHFVVLAVDESHAGATGCSIDTSVKFLKNLGQKLHVDFFNRLQLMIEEKGVLNYVHLNDLGAHRSAYVFNPMVGTVGDFLSNWKIPVIESPFIRL